MRKNLIILLLSAVSILFIILTIKSTFFPKNEPKYKESDKVSRLNKLSGAQKLLLAEQVHYHEFKKEFKVLFSNPKLLIRWEAKYEYLLDFTKQPLKINRVGTTLEVVAPPIELNEPKINLKKYNAIILSGNIFVNEHKLIVEEYKNLLKRSKKFGNEFLKTRLVQQLVHSQLKLFVLKLAAQLELKVDDVKITFLEKYDEKKEKVN